MCKEYLGKEPEALDIIQTKIGLEKPETEFDRAFRIKQQEDKYKKESDERENEWENRKNRAMLSIDDLLLLQDSKVEEERKKNKEQIMKDLSTKSGDIIGEAFKKKLNDSKMQLGPKAINVAIEEAIKIKTIQEATQLKGTHKG